MTRYHEFLDEADEDELAIAYLNEPRCGQCSHPAHEPGNCMVCPCGDEPDEDPEDYYRRMESGA